MKKIIFLFFFITFLFSCSSTNYVFKNKAQATGVDFRTGKWLLNEIDAPYSLEKKLNDQVFEDFQLLLNERVTKVSNAKGLLLVRNILMQPNKNTLKDIKTGTNFDYFINIKAKNNKNDLNSMSVTNHRYRDNNETNNNEVELEIYDLNTLEIIFSQKVVASTGISEGSNSDVHFSKTSNTILLKAYKKLNKKLLKTSIK